jgi:addiction module RelE/StbE family toxin
MEIKIEWTEPVLQDLETIVSYIESEWSQAIAHKFVDELLERVETLSGQPFMGMASQKHANIRSIKVSKHNRLYYKVEKDRLVLLNIFDLRQHPDKNIYS